MILTFEDLQPAPATMAGPFRRRRAKRREQAAKINEETSEMMKNALEGYNVGDVVHGADVVTGTHTGNPFAAPASSGIPMLPVLLIGGGLVVYLMVKK